MADYNLIKQLAKMTRTDLTWKGPGFFGELKRPDQKVSTELSVGTNSDGKAYLIPALVPGLTQEEINHLLGDGRLTKPIFDKAVTSAKMRMSQGKSPFAQEGEQVAEQMYSQKSTLSLLSNYLDGLLRR